MSVAQHSSVSTRVPIKAAAEHLGIKPPTLKKLVSEGKGPPVIRIGRRIIFDTADLDAYLAAHRHVPQEAVSSTTEAAEKVGAQLGPPQGPRKKLEQPPGNVKQKPRAKPKAESTRRPRAQEGPRQERVQG